MMYFDHAATTPVDRRVLEAMLPYFSEIYANASSSHAMGRKSAMAVDDARDKMASILKRKPKELYFTSGGTEADNWALKGIAYANRDRGKHVLVSSFEHPALLESANFLKKVGFDVEFLPVTENGFVLPEVVRDRMSDDTVLVSVMAANNEVGAVQPVAEIAEVVHERGAIFFSDFVQAMGEVDPSPADAFSCSSHKLYGPKGVGLLCVKEGIKIERFHHGGHQERSLRGGTTNTPAIVGFAEALSLTYEEGEERKAHIKAMRDAFLDGLLSETVTLNGDREKRLVSNANLCFHGKNGQALLNRLDLSGICASTGSACTSGAVHPSHVLLAMGKRAEASSSIRFTFGKDNTMEEVERAIRIIKKEVE